MDESASTAGAGEVDGAAPAQLNSGNLAGRTDDANGEPFRDGSGTRAAGGWGSSFS